MANLAPLFSSDDMTWETPIDLFNQLDEEFKFETDVCCLPETAKCKKYYTPKEDGLAQKWTGTCWMNPPYGRDIIRWMEKAYNESKENNSTVVSLIPSRTDTQYWHRYCMNASEIRFIKGRLKFGKSTNSAPFPSALVIFRGNDNNVKIKSFKPSNVEKINGYFIIKRKKKKKLNKCELTISKDGYILIPKRK